MSSRVSPATRLRRNRAVERTAALHALDRVDLADRARDRLDTLSGGQQRRVMVARALAEDSDTLVLDEPTAGVDLSNQQRLAATLGGLEGLTVLLVAHGLGAMAHLVTRAIVLQAGQIVHDGPTAPPGWVDIHHHDDDAGRTAAAVGGMSHGAARVRLHAAGPARSSDLRTDRAARRDLPGAAPDGPAGRWDGTHRHDRDRPGAAPGHRPRTHRHARRRPRRPARGVHPRAVADGRRPRPGAHLLRRHRRRRDAGLAGGHGGHDRPEQLPVRLPDDRGRVRPDRPRSAGGPRGRCRRRLRPGDVRGDPRPGHRSRPGDPRALDAPAGRGSRGGERGGRDAGRGPAHGQRR